MIAYLASLRSRQYLALLLAVLFCQVLACAKKAPKQTSMDSQYRKLKQDFEELEDRTAKIQLRLLEKEAQIKELEERSSSQQKMLDEAIQEVVRAKAKLRSLESKAEAASEMAEAEIAIKAIKVRLSGQEQDLDIVKAEQLLKMSIKEFQKENYGGTLYLTSQAKGHIRASQMRLGGRQSLQPVKGEVLFAQPLPLQVLKTSNLRQTPDLKGKIVTTLDKGTSLIGYSYKDQWVRVTREDGSNGWIFQTLVGGR